MSRPEYQASADVFYGEEESRKYAHNSRMHTVQRKLAERALEMLLLPEEPVSGAVEEGALMEGLSPWKLQSILLGALLLDLGFGCGISSQVLQEKGHFVVGIDISKTMIREAAELGNTEMADCLEGDLGRPFRFREPLFDGAISISAIQWLCSEIKTDLGQIPNGSSGRDATSLEGSDTEAMEQDSDGDLGEASVQTASLPSKRNAAPPSAYRRQTVFFQSLAAALKPGARAALQFYPDSVSVVESLVSAALRAGFLGGLVVDFPNSTKAKKYFLCLWRGGGTSTRASLPQALGTTPGEKTLHSEGRLRPKTSHRRSKKQISKREWIEKKKEQQRNKGLKVRPDSKYTGRKRKPRF